MRPLGLRGKVVVTLAAGFAVVCAVFLLVLVPLQRDQRERLLEQDLRLLATLKDKHQRDLIHDLLGENADALAVDLADLARQPRILFARVDAERLRLAASSDAGLIKSLLGADAVPARLPEDAVLLLRDDGRADLTDAAGRPLLRERAAARADALPPASKAGSDVLEWKGRPVLRYRAELRAGDTSFGTLEILSSLDELERSERLTQAAVLGTVLLSFLVLVVALDRVLSRFVLRPVQHLAAAMRGASGGDLERRLDVRSQDEIGAMAASFNAMVGDLSASKQEVLGYSRDLERRVLERTRELQQSEARARELGQHLEAVLAHVATGVLALAPDGHVTMANDRAAEVLGGPLIGRRLPDVLGDHPLLALVTPVLDGREARRTGQLAVRDAGGRRRLSVVAAALPEGAGVVVALEDVTQLIGAQRLEAWKEAVERVIHEIKNPLTPVGLSAQALRTAWAEDRARFETMFPAACDLILRSVQDLRTLITEFTRFSRLPRPVPLPHDVNALVRDVVDAFAASPPEGVAVETELEPGLPPADVDLEQVRRVLLNVVNNGLEAMEGRGGRLRVRTWRCAPSAVCVEIADDGCGVEDVERIFEPYYTTKAKGTGLGLVISRQVVEEHGGHIEVASRPGEGTCVRVVLPAVHDASSEGGEHGGAVREGHARERAGVVRQA